MSSDNVLGLGTHIKVKDVDVSRRFYEALGLKIVFAYGDEEFRKTIPESAGTAPEKYRGITFGIAENNDLEIAEDHVGLKDKSVFSEDIETPKISAMLKVKSLAPILEALDKTITFPVRKYYWGTIEAAFRDPDGYVIVAIAPFSDEEYAAVSKLREIEDVQPA